MLSRGAAKESTTFRLPILRELFFRRSAAGFVDAASYPGLTPLGYIFSPLRG